MGVAPLRIELLTLMQVSLLSARGSIHRKFNSIRAISTCDKRPIGWAAFKDGPMPKSLRRSLSLAVGALATTTLGGCYYGDVYGAGYASASGDCAARYGDAYYDYDPYAYDDGYGYGCYDGADYRGGFLQIGFGGGWYDDYYYPGYGLWMFDSYRNRYPLRGQYLDYWGGRRAWWKHRKDRGDGHWNGDRPDRPGGWDGRDHDRDGPRGTRPGRGPGHGGPGGADTPPVAGQPGRPDRGPGAIRPPRPLPDGDTGAMRPRPPRQAVPQTEPGEIFSAPAPGFRRPPVTRPAPTGSMPPPRGPGMIRPEGRPTPSAQPAPAVRPAPVARPAPAPAAAPPAAPASRPAPAARVSRGDRPNHVRED